MLLVNPLIENQDFVYHGKRYKEIGKRANKNATFFFRSCVWSKKDSKFEGFSLDSCRSIVALRDNDKSGMLGINEFTELWSSIRHWCSVFQHLMRTIVVL
ncbi:calpain small subunit 2-like protein [Leptotrombidium deliense]|uniref:Calpain small subunit 2-like protein n=1 Tax=Leptotrombidium deliense TaxID=299467 RepID=A0A443RZP1_9ACAR|nr:calpain small subunit 2-like protein [Leptotrombidium deliense]